MENSNLIGAVFAPSIVALTQGDSEPTFDFAIVIKGLVDFFLKMCEIELVFAGINFTLGNAVVWVSVVGVLIAFWNRMKGD